MIFDITVEYSWLYCVSQVPGNTFLCLARQYRLFGKYSVKSEYTSSKISPTPTGRSGLWARGKHVECSRCDKKAPRLHKLQPQGTLLCSSLAKFKAEAGRERHLFPWINILIYCSQKKFPCSRKPILCNEFLVLIRVFLCSAIQTQKKSVVN